MMYNVFESSRVLYKCAQGHESLLNVQNEAPVCYECKLDAYEKGHSVELERTKGELAAARNAAFKEGIRAGELQSRLDSLIEFAREVIDGYVENGATLLQERLDSLVVAENRKCKHGSPLQDGCPDCEADRVDLVVERPATNTVDGCVAVSVSEGFRLDEQCKHASTIDTVMHGRICLDCGDSMRSPE
jgi:hypothetical protein